MTDYWVHIYKTEEIHYPIKNKTDIPKIVKEFLNSKNTKLVIDKNE
jgi:hypothetical protein